MSENLNQQNERNNPLNNPDISVILPAMNEEPTIGICIQTIQKTLLENNLSGEIIVVDSSTDNTPDIARSMGAIVVHPKKRGYGNAYLEGFRHARGNIIVIGDSDGTYDFSAIPLLIQSIDAGADLVLGSRFMGKINKGSMPALHQYIGNPGLTYVLNMTFGTHFSDSHSGLRAIKKQALDRLELKSGGMEFASEMLIMASVKGLKVAEIPIQYYPRVTPSKLHSFADGWRHLRFILLLRPTPFLAIPGLLLTLLGGILMAIFSLKGDVNELHLNSFILGAILLIGGVQFLLTAATIKTYSVVHGYDKKEGIAKYLMDYHNLEKLLMLGGSLILFGIIFGIILLNEWIASDFGVLARFSEAISSLLFAIIGLQIILSSIFISMIILNNSQETGYE